MDHLYGPYGRASRGFENDSLHEECGVIGVYRESEDAARAVYYGLYALDRKRVV